MLQFIHPIKDALGPERQVSTYPSHVPTLFTDMLVVLHSEIGRACSFFVLCFSFFVDRWSFSLFNFRFGLRVRFLFWLSVGLANADQILDPEDDPDEEEEDGGAQDIDATRQAKSAVMKTSTRQVRLKGLLSAGGIAGFVRKPVSELWSVEFVGACLFFSALPSQAQRGNVDR